jgi:hypothetical protein
MSRLFRLAALIALVSLPLTGCVYAPYPYPYASNYDQAWSASVGAVRDAGVQVTSEDYGSGLIRGAKDGVNVTVSVSRMADGRVEVRFDSTGDTSRDPGLAQRFSQAYERRMGR